MLLRILSRRKGPIALATLLSTSGAAMSIALLGYINRLASSGVREPAEAVLEALGLVVATCAMNFLAQSYLSRFGAHTVAELRRELSERCIALDHEQLLAVGKARVLGVLIADVGRIAAMLMVLPLFFFNLTLALFCLGWLLMLSMDLFAIFALFMAFAVGSTLYLALWSGGLLGVWRDEEDRLFESFRVLTEGKKELTLNRARAEHFLEVVLGGSIDRTRVLSAEAQKWWNFSSNWANAMLFCALFTVVFVGTTWLGADGNTIVQFVVGTLFLMNPLNFLIGSAEDVLMGMTSVRKIKELGLDVQTPLPASPVPTPSWSTLAARGLAFQYSGDRRGFALGPLDLTIARGEVLFVVGGNGSGKTTLSLLLSGLVRPTSGHLELDGRRLGDADLPAYRQLFTAVFSDFFLFRHLLDREGGRVDDATAQRLIQQLDLGDKVRATQGELSRLDLSQGQRKRLALVQCYLDEADIYLFDEWAADQDPEFKDYFYTVLLPELKARGRTVIAITHDDRYFHCADRVVVLDRGSVSGVRMRTWSEVGS